MSVIKEAVVENHLKKRCKEHDLLCYKFTSGHNGVPDRIIIGRGRTIFLELKRPGEKPRRLQMEIMKRINDHGGDARWTDSIEGVDAVIDALISE